MSRQFVHKAVTGEHGSQYLHQKLARVVVRVLCGDTEGYDGLIMSQKTWEELGRPKAVGKLPVSVGKVPGSHRVVLSGTGFKTDRGVRIPVFIDRSDVRRGRRVEKSETELDAVNQ